MKSENKTDYKCENCGYLSSEITKFVPDKNICLDCAKEKENRKAITKILHEKENNKWKCKKCGSMNKASYNDVCSKCYNKDWNKENKDKLNNIVNKYRERTGNKRVWDIAQKKVKIEGLCQRCEKRPAQHRHHQDYNKPEEVELLCAKCHKEIHSPKNEVSGSLAGAKAKRNGCNSHSEDISNSELKTLDDLICRGSVTINSGKRIKQEAIKWVKKDKEDFIMHPLKNSMAYIITQRWMKRLNITDADLK